MPNVWTHILFGQTISQSSEITFPNHEKVFHLGAQGPDPFFYYHFWPWKRDTKAVEEIGNLIHKKHCGQFLIEMIKYLKERQDPVLKAYVFGFVSHHVLDRNAHPYIVYRSGKEGNKHQKLEIYIDTLMMKELRGTDTWRVPVYKEIDLGKKLPPSITSLVVKLIREIHQIRMSNLENIVNESYLDMVTALKVLFDPTGMKNKLFRGMIAPFSYTKEIPSTDFLNKEKREWRHPANQTEKSTESFYEILERAENEGIAIFKAIDQYLKGRIEIDQVSLLIKNISYDTGKPCNNEHENQFFEPIL